MNVLSLFDGISCGQIALERANIPFQKYYASEIDCHAIRVTQANYPKTIQLGAVQHIKCEQLSVDLLFGGSPCQGFSYAGKQLNFDDPRSKLFFEYVRVLKEVQPKYFLLENVKMQQKFQDVISDNLGVAPIEINSNLVSAQNRVRLYWTNIPNVGQPLDKGVVLQDILDLTLPFDQPPFFDNYRSGNPLYFINEKHPCLRAIAGSRTRGIGICDKNDNWRKLTPNECEALQTVPKNYTLPVIHGRVRSNAQRYKLLGNGWTIDVIVHILKHIKETKWKN